MSRFDLGNAADFAKLTMSNAGGLLNALTGEPEKTQWNIKESSFTVDGDEVPFHIFSRSSSYQAAVPQVQDHGGRRLVKYTFPFKDGQTTADLGRKPWEFDFDVLIHGNNYLIGVSALEELFDRGLPGTLNHPIRGIIQCKIEDAIVTHASSARKAAALRLKFVEHNFSVGDIRQSTVLTNTVKSALAQVLAVFAKIDGVINAVKADIAIVTSFKNLILSDLEEYKLQFGITVGNLNKTFNTSGGSSDLPAVLPVNDGGNLNADGSTAYTTYPLLVSPQDPFASVPAQVAGSNPDAETLTPALAAVQAVADVNTLRDQVQAIISSLSSTLNGQGALEFHDQIVDLKNSAIFLQAVVEAGLSSSKAAIIEYTTPRLMSYREVAFANGVALSRVAEIELLNPSLDSLNYIPSGTIVKVPV